MSHHVTVLVHFICEASKLRQRGQKSGLLLNQYKGDIIILKVLGDRGQTSAEDRAFTPTSCPL